MILVNPSSVRFNTGGTVDYRYPFAAISNSHLLTGASTTSSVTTFASPNFPFFDNRIFAALPTYILVCKQAGCARSSSTSEPLRVDADISITKVEEIPGECSSNVDCAPASGTHPSEVRARHFSANGDPARYTNCILFVGAAARPETRCVECFSDCDCHPGQFCYLPTGVYAGSGGIVIGDELSRLRAGSCMRKDMNNTLFGRKCRSQAYPLTPIGAPINTASAAVTSSASVPFVDNQTGPVLCSEGIVYNDSFAFLQSVRVNVTGQRALTLWQGYCDGEGICRECQASAASHSIPLLSCANTQVCLDGFLHRVISVDGTMRTLGNDTRASLLLAVVIFIILVLFLAAWSFCCNFCCKRGARKDAVTPAATKSAAP